MQAAKAHAKQQSDRIAAEKAKTHANPQQEMRNKLTQLLALMTPGETIVKVQFILLMQI